MQIRASLTIAGLIAAASVALVGVATSAVAYPTPPPPGITLSKTVGAAGTPFFFSGSGFKAHSTVTVTVDGGNSQTLTADASGVVTGQVTATTVGSHTLTLTGVDPNGAALVLATKFTIAAASGLPFTGAQIGGAAGLGALLLGGGALLLMGARRRRLAVAA